MITRIEAYRYRCFANLAVDVGEFNVIAGANGSGKTTLLDIPTLIGDMLQQRACSDAFLQTRPAWGGAPRAHTLTELIHQQRGEDFVLAIEAELPHEVIRVLTEHSTETVQENEDLWPTGIRYEIRLQLFNKSELQIVNEYLYLYPNRQRPVLGADGGLQGTLKATTKPVSKKGRPKLKQTHWRPIVFREPGDPIRYVEEVDTKARPQETRVSPTQLALSGVSVDASQFPAANWFRSLLEQQVVFYDPKWSTLRQASVPGQSKTLIPSGSNLPWLALDLKKQDPGRFAAWVEHVQTALPISSIDVIVREEDFHAYFVVGYPGGYQVTSSGLSDGTLRIMALTLIPYLIKAPALTVTEEPENGIHPKAIEVVLQSLTSVYDSQVWISTHSPIVLAHTELKQVLCARVAEDGRVEVVHGDQHPQLKEWKGSIDLGTLFAAGVLG